VKPARLLTALVLLVAIGGATLSARTLERIAPARSRAEQLLYLPNGRHLKVLSLGHASLLADLIYLWAIQYYSDYGTTDRFRHVHHIFGDVIAELDPHYLDAYWLGAMILTVEAHDLAGGLELLDQGIARNPDQWILPYLAGWECQLASQTACAEAYFARAAAVPGAPPLTRRMQAGFLARTGALDEARRLWIQIFEDPTSDDLSRAIARRKIQEVQTRIDLAALASAIDEFRIDNGRVPRDLAELARGGYIRDVPTDPTGQPYVYDASSGQVAQAGGRILGRR
jgi:type II secretion system (T2SS) protein G